MNGWMLACLVGIGGSAGALLRYGASRWNARRKGKPHLATLAVNLTGSLLLGLMAGGNLRVSHAEVYAFAGTGIMGGLTTYSTLNVQKAEMARARNWRQLAGYAAATYLGGWAAFAAGWLLGRAFWHQ
ncbi:CrcB family protein [Cohnella sp.]|uniref:fluoride efflux transporter FluC n=1 Tax=Cohnella sp. TaxID=1883426 RepID=UPI0025808213|nr:CrcB family protein [Cohnella sp.]